jgi:hypothetical protein
MVGVRVRFKNPVQVQIIALDKGNYLLSRFDIGPAGNQ